MAVIAQADVLRYLSTRGAFAGKSVLAPLRFHQHGYGYLLRPDMPDDEVTMEGCVTAMSRLARHMPDSQLAQVLGGKLDDVTEGRGGRS